MERIRVLVVDDEKDFVNLFIKRFSMRNMDVFGAGSGREAIEFLEENSVDVVVLDVKMPGMDGLETLKEIRKRHPKVEVIMLTGHGSVKTGIEGMCLGAYDYVLKPFNIEELLTKIRGAWERASIKKTRQKNGTA